MNSTLESKHIVSYPPLFCRRLLEWGGFCDAHQFISIKNIFRVNQDKKDVLVNILLIEQNYDARNSGVRHNEKYEKLYLCFLFSDSGQGHNAPTLVLRLNHHVNYVCFARLLIYRFNIVEIFLWVCFTYDIGRRGKVLEHLPSSSMTNLNRRLTMINGLYSNYCSSENTLPYEISNTTRIILKSAGILLCIVSLIFTVKLTVSMADNDFDKVLMATYGLAIELCKWIFIPLGVALLSSSKRIYALPCLVVGFVVVVVSVFASLGFLTSQNFQSTRAAASSSPEYLLLRRQIDNKQYQIEAIQERLNKDAKSNFILVRSNSSTKALQEIRSLEQEQEVLVSKLNGFDSRQYSSSGSLFVGLSSLLKKSVEWVELVAYVLTSVLVELCGMIALGLTCFSSAQENKEAAAKGQNRRRPNVRTSLKKAADGIPDTGTEDGLNNRYIKAREMISKKEIKPSFRSFKKALNVGDDTVRRYIDKLLEEGVIQKRGRGYEYAHN